MMRLWVATATVLALCQGCGAVPGRTPEPEAAQEAVSRQLLVMVREQSLPHYRPGPLSWPEYGGNSGHALRVARSLGRDYGFELLSDWSMPALGVRCFLVQVPDGESPAGLAARLARDPRVESAQPQQVFRVARAVDAPVSLPLGTQRVYLAALHRLATGRDIRVAQIDSGVDTEHPDLRRQLAQARNFVDGSRFQPEVHGTAVAGIIVAKPDHDSGMTGVAPGARLLPLRACWEAGAGDTAVCTSFTLAKALQFALNQRVRVINLSLTGPRDRLLERLIERAVSDGITVVSALDATEPGFPGTHPDVVAVVADGKTAPAGAVVAPGLDVVTTTPGAGWGFFSGSSFAAANVSGVAALLLQVSPSLSPSQVRDLLRQHTQASSAGPGLLDACAALAEAARAAAQSCRPGRAAGAVPPRASAS